MFTSFRLTFAGTFVIATGNGTILEEHARTSILLKSLIAYLTLLIITIIIVIFEQLGLADLKNVDDSVILATSKRRKIHVWLLVRKP